MCLVHKGAKKAARVFPTYVAGREGAMSIEQGYCTILNLSNTESLTHGILQDTSHRETVRIGGILRTIIMSEMQVSSFKTSRTGQHRQRQEASCIG